MELQSNAKSLVVLHLFSTQPEKCILKKKKKKIKIHIYRLFRLIKTSAHITQKKGGTIISH